LYPGAALFDQQVGFVEHGKQVVLVAVEHAVQARTRGLIVIVPQDVLQTMAFLAARCVAQPGCRKQYVVADIRQLTEPSFFGYLVAFCGCDLGRGRLVFLVGKLGCPDLGESTTVSRAGAGEGGWSLAGSVSIGRTTKYSASNSRMASQPRLGFRVLLDGL